MDTQINFFDAGVLGILGLSALIAFFRGFLREMMSLGAWVGATIITVYAFPHSTDFMKHHMKNANVAAGIGALGTFIAAIILISILTSIIMKYMKTGLEVGLLDNFLGLLFGVARGVFILSLAYLIMVQFLPKEPQPKWLERSFTKDYLQQGGTALQKVAPEYLKDLEGVVQREEKALKDEKSDSEKNDSDDNGFKHGTQQEYNRLVNPSGNTAPQR